MSEHRVLMHYTISIKYVQHDVPHFGTSLRFRPALEELIDVNEHST